MNNEKCDMVHPNGVKEKKLEVIGGYTIKYHANGATVWSKGKIVNDKPDGYWEWYRPDGTLKRSGYFDMGEPVGEWITYDREGKKHKITNQAKRPANSLLYTLSNFYASLAYTFFYFNLSNTMGENLNYAFNVFRGQRAGHHRLH